VLHTVEEVHYIAVGEGRHIVDLGVERYQDRLDTVAVAVAAVAAGLPEEAGAYQCLTFIIKILVNLRMGDFQV